MSETCKKKYKTQFLHVKTVFTLTILRYSISPIKFELIGKEKMYLASIQLVLQIFLLILFLQ